MKCFLVTVCLIVLLCQCQTESFSPKPLTVWKTSVPIHDCKPNIVDLRHAIHRNIIRKKKRVSMNSSIDGDDDLRMETNEKRSQNTIQTFVREFLNSLSIQGPPPPIKVENSSLLLYDVFLLINLTVSISFWVVHRMDFYNITPALSEGSLLCILWIISGLRNGSFLYSAVDGHYDTSKPENFNKGGPKSALLLGLSTMISTANLRILVALVLAVFQHRPVGTAYGEDLIPLEIPFGIMLMSLWRLLHSTYTMR